MLTHILKSIAAVEEIQHRMLRMVILYAIFPHSNQGSDPDDLTTTTGADHEIYCTQLLTKKRGYPLWVPGPGRRLPNEYRREGVSIGDVGIITSLGAFNFLFNLFQPAHHPINRGGVPRGFSPLSFGDLKFDIQEDTVYGPHTFLASSSVQNISMNVMYVPQFNTII